jgi:hypothetical protein
MDKVAEFYARWFAKKAAQEMLQSRSWRGCFDGNGTNLVVVRGGLAV